jgi:putative tricarboxylic transport membrane protein
MELLDHLISGFGIAFQPQYFALGVLGALLGTAIGVLPGLSPAVTISILLPVTFAIGDPIAAFIMFGGILFGGMYGGSTTSVLLRTPGESSAVVTQLDGYPMARAGRAGAALATAAIGGWIGSTVGMVGLMLLTEPMTDVALSMHAPDYFALMLLALTIVGFIGGHFLKGAFALCLGAAVSTVGIDFESGQSRFTYGNPYLFDGIDFVVAAIGVYAVSEVLYQLSLLRNHHNFAAGVRKSGVGSRHRIFSSSLKTLYMDKSEWQASARPWARGSVIGFIVGVLPGAGATIASFMSYGVERMVSRTPERFGKGAIEGVAAPEAANNASAGGALVPLLALGIPGSATTAVMLAAFQGYGIQTGPLLMQNNADLVWALIASLWIGNILLLILNLPLITVWIKLLSVPGWLLYPGILLISAIGVYSVGNSVFDVYVVFLLGVIGFGLRFVGVPLAPFLLSLILTPMIEIQLRRAVSLSEGDYSIFVTRPISATLLCLTALCVLIPMVVPRIRQKKKTRLGV